MLVLTRRECETIRADIGLEITVLEIHAGRVKLGIDAPRSITILRGELPDAEADAPHEAPALLPLPRRDLARLLIDHANHVEALFLDTPTRLLTAATVSKTLNLLQRAAATLDPTHAKEPA